MKRVLVLFFLCFASPHTLLIASDSEQVIEKLDSLEDAISNLSLRILVLEKKIISLEEKVLIGPTGKAGKRPNRIPDGPVQSGDDFSVGDVTYETIYNNTIFRGSITNKSNNSYSYALFKISVYDEKGQVLANNDFYILNFDKGSRRSFDTTVRGVKANEFDSYVIEFNKGP